MQKEATQATFLARKVRSFWPHAGLLFLFALPLLSGVLGRLFKGKPIYHGKEFNLIICAGERGADGVTMYARHEDFSCPSVETNDSYIYIPWLADVTHALRGLIGLPALLNGYAVLYALALIIAIGIPFFSPMKNARIIERAPFLGLLTGSVVLWGNIAGPAYAIMAIAALIAPFAPIVFVAAIVLVGAIKQVWLCALAVVLLLPRPWWERWLYFILGAAAGLAPTLWFLQHGGAEAQGWVDIVSYYAMVDRPGQGLFGWLHLFGMPLDSPLVWAIWLVLAALLVSSALGLAEKYQLTASERVWLGLAVATLLNPRLVAFEFFLIAPGMVAVVHAALKANARWVEKLVYGAAFLTLLMHVGDAGDYAIFPTTLACTLAIIAIGAPQIGFGLRSLAPGGRTAASAST